MGGLSCVKKERTNIGTISKGERKKRRKIVCKGKKSTLKKTQKGVLKKKDGRDLRKRGRLRGVAC